MQEVRFFDKEVFLRDSESGELKKEKKLYIEVLNKIDGTVTGCERLATEKDFEAFIEAYEEYVTQHKISLEPTFFDLAKEAVLTKPSIRQRLFNKKGVSK